MSSPREVRIIRARSGTSGERSSPRRWPTNLVPRIPTHPVDIAPASILAAHLGERADVDSYHHQAIRDVGEGLVATAAAPHGTVEAIEMPSASAFVLGVQWELHEEWQDDDASLSIWRAFVDAARARLHARTAEVPVP